MNTLSAFSQIIYGKLAIPNDSEYQIVAWNSQNTPSPIIPPYRFWGQSSPNINNIRTVGLVWHENKPILIQAATPINPQTNNQPWVFTNTRRSFTQYRYVFLTPEFLNQIQGKTSQLLEWLYQQTIPIYSQINQNIDCLNIPQFDLNYKDNYQKIQTFLNNSNQSLLLTAQDNLFNSKRVLLTHQDLSQPNDFLATVLLLLPIAIRNSISIAIGTIDENYCNWAQLIIKLNQSSRKFFNQNRLPDDVVWLNQSFNQKQEKISYKSDYVNCLQLITKDQTRLLELLTQLNQMNSEKITLIQPIHPQAIIPLIQFLPDEQKENHLARYLSHLNYQQLPELIELLKGNEQTLCCLAKELIKRDKQEYVNAFLEIWKLTEKPKDILPLINPDSDFTGVLLQKGLLKYHLEELTQNLTKLCCEVIANIKSPNKAWEFVCQLEQYLINYPQQCIELLYAGFSQQFQKISSELSQDYNYLNKIIILIPQLDTNKILTSKFHCQLKKQNPYAANLLDSLSTNKNKDLTNLPRFAIAMQMNIEKQDSFYHDILSHWQPNYTEAKDVLITLLELNQEQTIKFNSVSYYKTCGWFTAIKPELQAFFKKFDQNNLNWQIWYDLANILYSNQQEALLFLDQLLGKYEFKIDVLKHWLSYISENSTTIARFTQTSISWKSLQENEFNDLLRTIPQYAIILTYCLCESQRFSWIKGDLLYYLGNIWLKQKSIDENLINSITTPSIVNNFTISEYLQLIQIKWKVIAINYSNISNSSWSNTFNQKEFPWTLQKQDVVISKQHNFEIFDLKNNCLNKSDLSDDNKIKLTNIAKNIVKKYDNYQQLKILLDDCENWILSQSQIKEIIKAAKPEACTISLLFPYLKSSSLTEDQQLFDQFWQLKLKNEQEKDLYKQLINEFLIKQIKSNSDTDTIIIIQSKADSKLFTEALDNVVKNLISTDYLLQLTNLCRKLHSYLDIHKTLKELILKHLTNYL